jgi:predicted nucleic acid-binding protein
VIEEYIELLRRIGVGAERSARFRQRLLASPTVTRVNLGKRFPISRDADDDFPLATAHTGRARYLVTNDRDLLEIPADDKRRFRFEIVTPHHLLRALNH